MKLNPSFAARRRARGRAAGRGHCRNRRDAPGRRVREARGHARGTARPVDRPRVLGAQRRRGALRRQRRCSRGGRSARWSPMRTRSRAPSSRSTARPHPTSSSRCSPATGARSAATSTPRAPADKAGQDAALKTALLANANEIAVFLGGANPNLPVDVLKSLLTAHGSHHVQQIQEFQAEQFDAGGEDLGRDVASHVHDRGRAGRRHRQAVPRQVPLRPAMDDLVRFPQLPDVQSRADHRALAIDAVGIRRLRSPVTIRTGEGEQATVATFSMAVALPAAVKGTHMSRFVELLEERTEALDPAGLPFARARDAAKARREGRLGRDAVPALPGQGGAGFRRREPPRLRRVLARGAVDGRKLFLSRESRRARDQPLPLLEGDLRLRRPQPAVAAQHRCRADARPWRCSELIEIAESAASCEVYGVLKRPDEKYVTERAYENPKFAEDLVRDVAVELNRDAARAQLRGRSGKLRVDPQPLGVRPHHESPPARGNDRLQAFAASRASVAAT